MSPLIRTPLPQDEPAWRALWAGYNHFYRTHVPGDVTASLWQKLLSPTGDITALVAESGSAVTGFAHILFHPSSWSLQPGCYLEDLFVAPASRGTGIARALIEACASVAKQRGADRLYWHTQEFNAPARSLYDSMAQRTSFIVYRKEL
jgi:GNAT superfamily N-acetyltransferase